jgi:hypothetical protein
MAIWHKEENETRRLDVWFADLLKQSGFHPRNPVFQEGRELVADCGSYIFRLGVNQVRVIGRVSSAMQLQLLKAEFGKSEISKDDPDKPGKLSVEIYSILPNEVIITARQGISTFKKILDDRVKAHTDLQNLLRKEKHQGVFA